MRAAGIRGFSSEVELLELPAPGPLRVGEVLIEVRCCGVGNWDDIARTGGWDLGRQPPMALGVEAAGVVAAAGAGVDSPEVGDRVMTHSVPLRDQGAWAVTGSVIVQLAVHLGVTVIATAGPRSSDRAFAAGAAHVLDHRSPDWPGQVRALTGGLGADLAVNAAPGAAALAITAVRDGGKLATITSDAPAAERGIDVSQVYVAPDGPRLTRLGELLATGVIGVVVGACHPLEDAAPALAHARRGAGGQAIVLQPSPSSR